VANLYFRKDHPSKFFLLIFYFVLSYNYYYKKFKLIECIIKVRVDKLMKIIPLRTLIIYSIIFLLILIVFKPSFSTSLNIEKSENTCFENSMLDRGWIWKEPFPNYSPKGLPDFDQKQKQWKSIVDGGNGIVESSASNDDIQFFDVGSEILPGEIIIAPGENCQLDSIASGDDITKWAFSGPTALANCFWWFDSKFADPSGFPGDDKDKFPLVEKYVDDDHSSENVPYLIEDLAITMNTTYKGETTIENLSNAIDIWLENKSLDDRFEKTIYHGPSLDLIEEQILDNQNVILMMGFYDYEIGEKRPDQSQPIRSFNKLLQNNTWWDYQSFTPIVDRIDAIRIPLRSTSSDTCDIEINIYDNESTDPLASSSLDPGYLSDSTWIQFHFEPGIELIPFETYFFDVRQLESGYHYEWFYGSSNPYDQGVGWMDQNPYDIYGLPFDWTFETEYYDPPPGSIRRNSRVVTCAGVNYEDLEIAFSDPLFNINNTNDIDHNDAKNISYDIFFVEEACPCPDLNYSFWLTNYPTYYSYSIVEQAVVICPIPDTIPPEIDIIKPKNSIYFIDKEVYPFILPVIIGFIEIEVNVTDNRDVDSVEFLINGESMSKDSSPPYKWKWEEGAFFIQTIKIDAVDSAGNHGYDLLTVLKFF
jgi:hypothetical protein